MVAATFLRLKIKQQLIKLRLHHCSQIKKRQEQGYNTVRIRSSDSDVFFILLHHAFKLDITILFDTGSDNTRRLLIVIHIANNDGQKLCTAFLSLCAFTRREN